MTQQIVNVGSVAGDGTGDKGQTPFNKTNSNFTELYGTSSYFGVDSSGAANVCTVLLATLKPNPTAFPSSTGTILRFTPANANSGAATLNGVAIVNSLGAALTGGELQTTNPISVEFNGTAWQLLTTGTSAAIAYLLNALTTIPVTADKVRTAAEIAASVTPTNFAYAPGNILRYGTNTTPGTTDLSTALASALVSNTQVYCPGSLGPYFFAQAAPFNLTSGQTLYGDGPSTVLKFSFNTGNNLQMSNIVGAVVRDLAIQVTGSGATSYIGAVAIISGSTDCKVERVKVTGVSGNGVHIATASSVGGVVTQRNMVRNCSFSAFNVGNQDQADIYIGQTSGSNGCAYNVIEGNECFGGGWHGIIMQSQNAGTGPNVSNLVTNNRIGTHLAYGIANYSGAATVDNFNQIIGNYIENIQGSALSGQSGGGIYSVAAGGNLISNNTLFNCCAASTTLSGSTAGIAVTGVASGLTPVVVSGNIISAQTKFSSIQISNCQSGVTVTGNTIQAPVSNVTGSAIFCRTSSVLTLTGNIVNQVSGQEGITVQADANLTQVVIADNVISHAGSFGIHVSFTAAFTTTGIVIKGNTVTSASSINIVLGNAVQAAISDNICLSNTTCIQLTTSTQARLTNNVLTSTGAAAFATSGACLSSLFNESNYCSSSAGVGIVAVNNAGTGCNVRQLGTGVPGAGTQILGDAVYNTAGVTPFAWSCTTAGTPGTFTGLTLP